MMTSKLPWAKSPYWVVDPPEDYSKFFGGIVALGFPPDARAVIEGTSFGQAILDLLQPFFVSQTPGRRFLLFRSSDSRRYEVPLEERIFAELSLLSQNHAEPEICNEFLISHGTEYLLSWYDFPDDPFYISCLIPEQVIKRFCDSIGSSYRRESAAL
jgi:hypothetical protein